MLLEVSVFVVFLLKTQNSSWKVKIFLEFIEMQVKLSAQAVLDMS